MFKHQIAEFVRRLIEQSQTFAQSLGISELGLSSISEIKGYRQKELFKTAQILLATAAISIVVFLIVLVQSFDVNIPSSPELSDLSQSGFSFVGTAQAAETNSKTASSELHLFEGSYWVLQSSKDTASAEKAVEQCAQHGVRANYYQVVIDGEIYYRVILSNRFDSKAQAKASRRFLPEGFQQDSWVMDIDEAIVVWR